MHQDFFKVIRKFKPGTIDKHILFSLEEQDGIAYK
jgi:hypothetical protein